MGRNLRDEPEEYQISVIINNMMTTFGADKVRSVIKNHFISESKNPVIFGKEVDEMMFTGHRLTIHFIDGNTVSINFKESSFKSPVEFLKWIDSQNEQQKKAA